MDLRVDPWTAQRRLQRLAQDSKRGKVTPRKRQIAGGSSPGNSYYGDELPVKPFSANLRPSTQPAKHRHQAQSWRDNLAGHSESLSDAHASTSLQRPGTTPASMMQGSPRKPSLPRLAGDVGLPADLDGAPGHPLSMMALEQWNERNSSLDDELPYESPLLECELRLRELKGLNSSLERPNPVTAAIACNLCHRVAATLPQHGDVIVDITQRLCGSIYSNELSHTSGSSLQAVPSFGGKALPRAWLDHVPYFTIARQHSQAIAQMTSKAEKLQVTVDQANALKRDALKVCTRMQFMRQMSIQSWLLAFWKVFHLESRTYHQKLEKLTVQSSKSIAAPFMHWRMLTCLQHGERCRVDSKELDDGVGKLANAITNYQVENEELRKQVDESVVRDQELKERCEQEQNEHMKLRQSWEATRPELLRSVLSQTLGFFFGFLVRTGGLSDIETKRRLHGRDLSAIGEPGLDEPLGPIMIRWLNFVVGQVKEVAQELLNSPKKLKNHKDYDQDQADRARAQMVIETPEATDLDACLKDGKILTCWLAGLRAHKFERDVLMKDTWPFDDKADLRENQTFWRDPDRRANEITSSMRSTVPTAKVQCLLRSHDIIQGNAEIMTIFLAATFLHCACLPMAPPMPKLELPDDDSPTSASQALKPTIKFTGSSGEPGSPSANGSQSAMLSQLGTGSSKLTAANLPQDDLDPDASTTFGDVSTAMSEIYNPDASRSVSADKSIALNKKMGGLRFRPENTVIMSERFDCHAGENSYIPKPIPVTPAEKMAYFIERLEDQTALVAYDVLQDPARLLHSGEDVQDLTTISAEQLLLRWMGVQLSAVYHKPVENFGSDLKDGLAIFTLIHVVAPDIVPDIGVTGDSMDVQQRIIAASARCTSFEVLTPEVLIEGQSDMLAAFLCSLFLHRPHLDVQTNSLLFMHLRLLDDMCRQGYAVLEKCQEQGDEAAEELTAFCAQLEEKEADLRLAVHCIQEVRRIMTIISERVQAFLGHILAHRARNDPVIMLDAKEERDFHRHTAVNPLRVRALISMDEKNQERASLDEALVRIEDLLRKHFRLFREMYKYYSTHTSVGSGITLESLMRIYQDCRLRSRDFPPHIVESIFNNTIEETSEDQIVLPPEGFVEAMLHFASIKYARYHDNLPEQMTALIDLNLKPLACQEHENFFRKMAYDTDVRLVLRKHIEELKIIFQVYAAMDTSSTEALQRSKTMNVSEFHMLLEHCNLLDQKFSNAKVKDIFDQIQQSATDYARHEDQEGDDAMMDDGEDGLSDDDELSFSEFLDGLVAIVIYKEPNPFTPFHERVDQFLVDRFFSSLRHYWSRSRQASAHLKKLLNALQKKVKMEGKDRASIVSELPFERSQGFSPKVGGKPKVGFSQARTSVSKTATKKLESLEED